MENTYEEMLKKNYDTLLAAYQRVHDRNDQLVKEINRLKQAIYDLEKRY